MTHKRNAKVTKRIDTGVFFYLVYINIGLNMGKIKLGEISTRAPKEFDKAETKEKTQAILEELDELQNLLFAESKHAVLVVIQGRYHAKNWVWFFWREYLFDEMFNTVRIFR